VSTQTVETAGVGTMPRVNLMPPEIAEAARFRQLQLAMGAGIALSVVIVGGLYMHEHSGVSSAQAAVNTAQAQHSSLQTKLSSLQTVQDTFAAVQAKQNLLDQAMGQEIRWSYYLNDLALKIPSNVWLNSVQASESTAPGATSSAAPTTSSTSTLGTATTPTDVGSVTFDLTGLRHDDVAKWLDALARLKGFSSPTFSTSVEGAIGNRGVVTAESQVTLTSAALSGRYTPKAGS
jgi:Tfp pilus assembly protein PilN